MSTSLTRAPGRVVAALLAAVLAFSGLALVGTADAAQNVDVERIPGSDRYASSAAIAIKAYPGGAANVIVANGFSYADALSGAALAGHLDAPILLVPASSPLPTSVAHALGQMSPALVTVLGGSAAVSESVEAEINALGYPTDRIDGSDRYETSQLIAAEIGAAGLIGTEATAIVATGLNFPDALAAGPLAYSGEHPIILTRTASLTPAAATALQELDVDSVIIMGGESAVSADVAEAIEDLGIDILERIGGTTRYDTAADFADFLLSLGWNADAAGLANFTNGFGGADALAAAPLLGEMGAVLLGTAGSLPAGTETWLEDNNGTIADLLVFGGTAAVSASVVADATAAATAED